MSPLASGRNFVRTTFVILFVAFRKVMTTPLPLSYLFITSLPFKEYLLGRKKTHWKSFSSITLLLYMYYFPTYISSQIAKWYTNSSAEKLA
jgi:hypothetical protein